MIRYIALLECMHVNEIQGVYNPFIVDWPCKINDQCGWSAVIVAMRIKDTPVDHEVFARLINRRPDNAKQEA